MLKRRGLWLTVGLAVILTAWDVGQREPATEAHPGVSSPDPNQRDAGRLPHCKEVIPKNGFHAYSRTSPRTFRCHTHKPFYILKVIARRNRDCERVRNLPPGDDCEDHTFTLESHDQTWCPASNFRPGYTLLCEPNPAVGGSSLHESTRTVHLVPDTCSSVSGSTRHKHNISDPHTRPRGDRCHPHTCDWALGDDGRLAHAGYTSAYCEEQLAPPTTTTAPPTTTTVPPTTTTVPPTTTTPKAAACPSGQHKHGRVMHSTRHDSCHSHSCRWAGEHSSKAAHAAGVLHDGPCGGTTTTTTTVPDTPSKNPVTTTTVPTCDANEELVNGVCVPVCVWGHDHGLGCHPPTNPPCSYAAERGTGRHWHGWHHSSCHNQDPPCPTGQHRHGDGRESTYRPGSHPHWSDTCHARSRYCTTGQHRHGTSQKATYLGLYTHRAGSESHYSDACHNKLPDCTSVQHRHGNGRKATFTPYSHRAANSLSHWSDDCHTKAKRYCDAGKHRHNTIEGEAVNYRAFRHPHYPDECHPDDPKPICGEHEHIHSDANSYSTNEHLPGTLFKHWKVECHIDWACDPRPNTASHDPLYDDWLRQNRGYRWREPTWGLWGHSLSDDPSKTGYVRNNCATAEVGFDRLTVREGASFNATVTWSQFGKPTDYSKLVRGKPFNIQALLETIVVEIPTKSETWGWGTITEATFGDHRPDGDMGSGGTSQWVLNTRSNRRNTLKTHINEDGDGVLKERFELGVKLAPQLKNQVKIKPTGNTKRACDTSNDQLARHNIVFHCVATILEAPPPPTWVTDPKHPCVAAITELGIDPLDFMTDSHLQKILQLREPLPEGKTDSWSTGRRTIEVTVANSTGGCS